MIIIIVIIVTYFAIKVLEKKEHHIGKPEGLYTPDLILKKLGLKGVIL